MTRRAAALAAVLLAAPAAAAAHQDREAGPPAPGIALAPAAAATLEALARLDLEGARAAAARLQDPEGEIGTLVRAQVAFHEGEYAAAARLLDALPPGLAAAPGVAELRRLVAASQGMLRGLEPRASEHFVLWHDPQRDGVLVGPALEALERAREAAGAWLGDFPPGRVRVEVAPSAADFERVSGLRRAEIETAGAVAICRYNRILLLSPRLLLRGYRWRDTLCHEYLHYLLVRVSANRAPIWLQEGAARHGEAIWRGVRPRPLTAVDRSLVARALREGALVPFAAMDPSLVRLPTPGAVRLAFAESALAVARIVELGGDAALRRVLAELARGGPAAGSDGALRAALGVGVREFEEGLRASLAAGGFREVPGLVVPPLRLANDGGEEAWDLAEWQGEGARNHLRLGDLLRARGSLRAALLEYRRALELAPASPYAHLRAARVELELGRAERAAAAAAEAVRVGGDLPAAHRQLGAALAALGRHAEAASALEEAVEINPFDPYAWRDLAAAYGATGRGGEARRARNAALRLARGGEEMLRMLTDGPGSPGGGTDER